MKYINRILIITFLFTAFSCVKYEDGPALSFRSKKNRAADRIGKYWKSDTYTLKMGQTGYAISLNSDPAFFDQGNWEFDDTKTNIKFLSEDNEDYQMSIKQLMKQKMKLEGAFPIDGAASQVHEFKLDKVINEL